MLLPHKITINKKLPNKITILRTWLFDPTQKKPMKQKEKQSLPLKEKPKQERRLIVNKLCERETALSVEEIV